MSEQNILVATWVITAVKCSCHVEIILRHISNT